MQLKNQRGQGAKTCVAVVLLSFWRNYDILKLKGQSFLLNKTEWKMKNPTHALGETNLHQKLESQIKSKTVMSWSLRKKKECIFPNDYFVLFFLTSMFFISMYRVFSVLNKVSEYNTFTYNLIHFCCLLLKSS